MHKHVIYLSIYFCLTCLGLSRSPSLEAGVQLQHWFTIPCRLEPLPKLYTCLQRWATRKPETCKAEVITIISIQPLSWFWQETDPSQASGMALACCFLGKFLGVVCHCIPLPLYVPTFAARCLHVPINTSAPSSERWNSGREWSSNFAEMMPFYAI
jgi:hypothetical protein